MGCAIEVSFVFLVISTEQTPLRDGKVITLRSMDHTTRADLKRAKNLWH